MKARVIRLADPLPCGMSANAGLACGRTATAAYAYAVGRAAPATVAERLFTERYAGHWLVLPVCERCAKDMAERYKGS